ncbi:MAG: hypothetical protein MJ071_07295 [Oscillospiraceae bacterium]|nr:hypothetical protein [Oscillospiraceae bacterium]
MKKYIKTISIYTAVFAAAVFLCTLLLVLSAMIPRQAIKENMQRSSEYLAGCDLFTRINDNINGSVIDHYADTILLEIAYAYDSEHPLKSVMWAKYYPSFLKSEVHGLMGEIDGTYTPFQQYLRYWHGSTVIVQCMHLFTDLPGMYICNAILMVLLTAILLFVLFRYNEKAIAFGTILSLCAVGIWFVPLSLEYTWTILIMLIVSILAVFLEKKNKAAALPFLFFISGIVTNYMDFLTTETLSMLMPLLYIIALRHKRRTISKKDCLDYAKYALLWSIGYVGMWLMKWGIAAVVLRENTIPYVSQHIAERLGGQVDNLSPPGFLAGALYRNIKCLFPLGYGKIGFLVGLLLITGIIAAFFRKKEGRDRLYIGCLFLIAFVPYVRFLILHNHAYLHYFFTYRAQAAAVFAVYLILMESVDCKLPYLKAFMK